MQAMNQPMNTAPAQLRDRARRRWLAAVGAAGLGALLPAARARGPQGAQARGEAREREAERQAPVSAAEDLMREHGVLRRALLVYAEAAARLQRDAAVPADALAQAARLFRRFGEDYHERALEERHVFPALAKAGGAAAELSKVLIAQHERGRQITDYILATTRTGRIAPADAQPLATSLADFARMYHHHSAVEDTVAYPAWKAAIAPERYGELAEEFERLEHRLFGEDGFEDAVAQVGRAERAFGLADLARLTAVPPPAPDGG